MASPTSPQHSPLSCQYCYKYNPSLSTSVCPISYFGLSCNFDKLAKKYPDFQSALDDHLNGKQCGNDLSQQQKQSRRLPQKKESSIHDPVEDPDSTSISPTSTNNTYQTTTTLSTAQRTHNFNTSLTRSLLHYHFNIQLPSLPVGHLCPPIPNRANYICWLNELLIQSQVDLYRFATASISSSGEKDEKRSSREIDKQIWQCQGVDIGTGVSAIYPLLLTTGLFSGRSGDSGDNGDNGQLNKATTASTYPQRQQQKQWKFLATDIDPTAIQSANTNVQANHLENQIHIVQVKTKENDKTSQGMKKGPLFSAMEEAKHHSAFQSSSSMSNKPARTMKKKEDLAGYPKFDFVMTNPPFYSTLDEAKAPRAGDKRCRTDMSTNEGVYSNSIDMDENDNDEGGDVGFVTAIMNDSQYFRQNVTWYTSLIAKRSSLDALLYKLQTLDGVWGNRGQIRTVEFHQANLDTNESDRSNNKKSSNRVRWGIGWTYERAIGRCSACRVRGGLQLFDISIDVGDNTADNTTIACDEVISRLTSYFDNLRDVSLKCSQEMKHREDDTASEVESSDNTRNKLERCVTVVEERFHNCNPSCLPQLDHEQDNINLPYEGHFVIDAFVVPDKKEDDRTISIQVVLEMYSHTKHGTSILNKIRGPLQGEITRTNRKWRRLRKRQAEEV